MAGSSRETVDVVMNRQYAVDVLTTTCEHNRKNFLREAAKTLARRMLEDGCIAVHETYSPKHDGYMTTFTVLTGRQNRRLP